MLLKGKGGSIDRRQTIGSIHRIMRAQVPMTLAVFGLCLFASAAARGDALKAIVFDIEPAHLDMTPQLKDRLKAASDQLRKLVADRGYVIVDPAPQEKKIKDNLPLSECNGCDHDIAKALGADIEVTSAVEPSSALVLSLSGNVKDVASDRVLRKGGVGINGSGADVWDHGVRFLVKERLFEPPLPTDRAGLRKLVEEAPKPGN